MPGIGADAAQLLCEEDIGPSVARIHAVVRMQRRERAEHASSQVAGRGLAAIEPQDEQSLTVAYRHNPAFRHRKPAGSTESQHGVFDARDQSPSASSTTTLGRAPPMDVSIGRRSSVWARLAAPAIGAGASSRIGASANACGLSRSIVRLNRRAGAGGAALRPKASAPARPHASRSRVGPNS